MSFEVYVECYEHGKPAGVPRTAINSLFPVVEAESEPDYWSVRYDDSNSCHVHVSPLASDPSSIKSLCVLRPCDDPRLWDALFAVMQLGAMVLYFPGCFAPLVGFAAAGEHFPADMTEALGRPCVVTSGRDIFDTMERS